MNPDSTVETPVGAQTHGVDCPKCGQVIHPAMDTRPNGKIVCDACKAKFASLDALLKAAAKARPPEPQAAPAAELVLVALIDPNPEQPRREFDEAALKELAGSITEHGLIQPIVVHRAGDRFILHDGERRLRAARLAGLAAIPAFIAPTAAGAQTLLLRAVVANDQRADLTAIERARAYQRLADEFDLSDSDIARQVGKSRSAVSNTRRLLGLPKEQQAQVVAGELNERQAMALLPVYQLPEDIRKDVLETWNGQRLAKATSLTSDQIRRHATDAIRSQGQELDLIDPGQVFEGEGIRCPTCDACELYVKSGNAKLCLDKACHKIKQAVVIRAYLDQAAAATGVAYLDPATEYSYGQVDGFTGKGAALLAAQRKACPNLRLAYNLRSWDYGPAPEKFGKCRFVCLHDDGQNCACAEAGRVVEKAAGEEQKKAAQRLTGQAVKHLANLIKADPVQMLPVILYALTNEWGGRDKVLAMKYDKVVHELAGKLLRSTGLLPSEYRSDPVNREAIRTGLEKLGLPQFDQANTARLAELDRRLERIGDWAAGLYNAVPTPEQVAGNLANLAELANEAQALQDEGGETDRAALDERAETQNIASILDSIDRLKTALLALQPLVAAHQVAETGEALGEAALVRQDAIIEIDHVSWLVTVPAKDSNFKDHLNRVDHVATCDYALALVQLFNPTKAATGAIQRRRAQIEERDEARAKARPAPEAPAANGQQPPAINGNDQSIQPMKMFGAWFCGRCKADFPPGWRFWTDGFDKGICAGCLAELQGALAPARAFMAQVTARLDRDDLRLANPDDGAPPLSLQALKEFRSDLAEMVRPLSQAEPEPEGLAELLAEWEALDDRLHARLQNFEYKPLFKEEPA